MYSSQLACRAKLDPLVLFCDQEGAHDEPLGHQISDGKPELPGLGASLKPPKAAVFTKVPDEAKP